MNFEPISIIGVIVEEVGSPSNDGSRGSALYAVPIRLSRRLMADESELLRQLWDRPPSFSTMHRPGIAYASGDRFMLDGTTIDEVASVHAHTLRLVVDQFNSVMSDVRNREAREAAEAQASEAAHLQAVAEMATAIRFE